MTASRLRAAALYEPLMRHSPADILSYRIRNLNLLSAVTSYKKVVFSYRIKNGRIFRRAAPAEGSKMQIF